MLTPPACWPSPQVGCGKSSLLAALLGELQPLLPLHRTAAGCTLPQPLLPVGRAATDVPIGAAAGAGVIDPSPLSSLTGRADEIAVGGPSNDHEKSHVLLDLRDDTEDLDLDLDLDQLAPVICGSIAYCSQVGLSRRSLRDHHGVV